MSSAHINIAALRGSPFSTEYRETIRRIAEMVGAYGEIMDSMRELCHREWGMGGGGGGSTDILVRTSNFVPIGPNRWKYGFAEVEFVWQSSQAEQKVATAVKEGGVIGNPAVVGGSYLLNAYELGNDGFPPEVNGSPYIGGTTSNAPLQPMPVQGGYAWARPVFTEPVENGATVYLGAIFPPLRPKCPGAGHVGTGPGTGGSGGVAGGAARALMELASRIGSV